MPHDLLPEPTPTDSKRDRTIRREKHQLPPQRWRAIVILTDTPAPGQSYLGKEELLNIVTARIDLPEDISFEWGTVEKAAQGS